MSDTAKKPDAAEAAPEAKPDSRGLHQISMRYDAVEDRVLLIITTTDGQAVKLWMTRHFVRTLWKGLPKVLAAYPSLAGTVDREAQDAVLAMRHQEAVQGSDFDTPFKGELPPAEEARGVPLLVGVQGGVRPDGSAQFTFKTRDGGALTFSLSEQLLHAFCHLLIEVTAKANWDLEMRVGEGNVVVPEGGKRVH